jgi:hypothetical protein
MLRGHSNDISKILLCDSHTSSSHQCFRNAAQELETESGYQLESPSVTRFRESVLKGNWDELEQLTEKLDLDEAHEVSVGHTNDQYLPYIAWLYMYSSLLMHIPVSLNWRN